MNKWRQPQKPMSEASQAAVLEERNRLADAVDRLLKIEARIREYDYFRSPLERAIQVERRTAKNRVALILNEMRAEPEQPAEEQLTLTQVRAFLCSFEGRKLIAEILTSPEVKLSHPQGRGPNA